MEQMPAEPEQDPDNYSKLREIVLLAFNNSRYWGYKPHIPEQWSGMRILQIFRG